MLSVSLNHNFERFSLDVHFEAPPGITVLFGRSGSGKTTVVNALAGIVKPDRGRVSVNGWTMLDMHSGVCLPPHKRRLGVIFQEGRLFPHLTVRSNLRYGQWFAPKDGPREDMDRVVGLLGIGHLLDRRPAHLSGGEKQRVAIGRALLASPRLILADEPLAALDEHRKAEILPYFERLRDEIAVPILYVSHSPTEVARLATSVVALQEGRVIRQGAAADVLGDPGILPVGAREAGALISATVVAHHGDGLTELAAGNEQLFLPALSLAPGSTVRVRIAAHDVMIATANPSGLSALNILPGRVAELHQGEGPGAMLAIETGAGRILARVTRRSVSALGLSAGKPVFAVVKSVSVAPSDVGAARLRG